MKLTLILSDRHSPGSLGRAVHRVSTIINAIVTAVLEACGAPEMTASRASILQAVNILVNFFKKVSCRKASEHCLWTRPPQIFHAAARLAADPNDEKGRDAVRKANAMDSLAKLLNAFAVRVF